MLRARAAVRMAMIQRYFLQTRHFIQAVIKRGGDRKGRFWQARPLSSHGPAQLVREELITMAPRSPTRLSRVHVQWYFVGNSNLYGSIYICLQNRFGNVLYINILVVGNLARMVSCAILSPYFSGRNNDSHLLIENSLEIGCYFYYFSASQGLKLWNTWELWS